MEISSLIKLKVMSREKRVFVSLIVWLFSVTGADGKLTKRPENYVLVRGSVATFRCTSDKKLPTWRLKSFIDPEDDYQKDSTDENCKSSDSDFKASQSDSNSCDLLVNNNTLQTTYEYTCTDIGDTASGILIFLESPLKCGIEDNHYSCTMDSSAYQNQSEIDTPYLSSLLSWKDATGYIVASQYTDFNSTKTVVTAAIPYTASRERPYVCSAEFKIVGNLGTEYSPIVNIVPDGKVECKFPETAEDEKAAQEAAVAATAAPAAAIEMAANATDNATSNAKLERDGVEAIAMLLSLMAAFLVH